MKVVSDVWPARGKEKWGRAKRIKENESREEAEPCQEKGIEKRENKGKRGGSHTRVADLRPANPGIRSIRYP